MIITAKMDGKAEKFLNVKDLMTEIEKRKLRAHQRIGYFVRDVAQKTLRFRKGASKPGQPPSSHGKADLRERMIYNADKDGVEIGPQKFNKVFWRGYGQPVKGLVPEVLEFGGAVQIMQIRKSKNGKWTRFDQRQKRSIVSISGSEIVMNVKNRKGKINQVKYPMRMQKVKIKKRPYMQVALKKAQGRKKYETFFKLLGPVSIK